MPKIDWEVKYSVNVKELDRQHTALINLINECNDSLEKDDNNELFSEIVFKLILYSQTHFTTEEEYMEKTGYSKLKEHKKEHSVFTEKIKEYEARLNENDKDVANEIMGYLINWLIDHILNMDQKYSEALNKAGIK